MKSFKINENDAGQRLSRFIEKMFHKVPKSLIYKLIRKKRIKVNFKRSHHDYILKEEDFVLIYGLDNFLKEKTISFNSEFFKNFKLDVVYEDENIIVINKQGGIKTQPNSKTKDSLVDFLVQYLVEKNEYFFEKENSFRPAFCTRLDTNTKGLVVAGKNKKALSALNELTLKGNLKKTYIAIVEGNMRKKREILVGYWSKDNSKNIVNITANKRPFSKKVITEYFVLNQFSDRAKIKIFLYTGKSHQIRAHMKSISHPIVGDFKYGSKFKEDLKLCCFCVEFKSKGSFLEYLDNKKIALKKNIF